MTVDTVEQRIGITLAQVILDNAKLGFIADTTREQLHAANERANELSVQVTHLTAQMEMEKDRADRAQIEIEGLAAQVRKFEALVRAQESTGYINVEGATLEVPAIPVAAG